MLLLITLTLFAPFVIVGATIADNADCRRALGARDDRRGPTGPAGVGRRPAVHRRAGRRVLGGMAHDTRPSSRS
jgi:hypothetical protein